MDFSHFRIIITVCFIHHLVFTGRSYSAVQHCPVDDIAVNCGFSGSSFASDGREWIGDMDSTFTSPKEVVKAKSIISSTTVHQSLCADHVPYITPRISRSQFTYTSQLRPGQKIIRLHFCPASYPGFERSKALFTVKAGPYTLLSNFSTSLTADALGGVSYFAKEFCVNIEENQVFNITFSPSKRTCDDSDSDSDSDDDDDVYAFINGIEIVSMPTGLYYTPDGDLGPPVVGNKFFRYYIDNGTALETVHRLNVGGRPILPVEDLGLFRMWSDDKNYLLQSSSLLHVSTSNIMITYTNIPTHSAPLEVYQTTWSTKGPNQQTNQVYNFTWKLPVDLGFRYLVRLHFCELQPTSTTEGGQRQLDLLINNKKIEVDADVIKLGSGAAVYRDYVVMMEGDRMDGRRDLIIALLLSNVSSSKKVDAIVKGIEVFKLSNPDNNLAGGNPVFTANAPISRNTPRFQKLVLAFGSINTIPTVIVLVISTLLYFSVYHLKYVKDGSNHVRSWWWWLCGFIWRLWELLSHRWTANYRIFSVAEIRALTNNFNDGHLINTENGWDGMVYEGYMEEMGKVVIKRYFTVPTGTDGFYNSLRVQSQLECINMVSLVGYCLDYDGHEMILVHEYMANGTLFDHLDNTSNNNNNNQCLSWKQRLQICIGAARGLNYLHTGVKEKTIIHGDVKLSNILLDENWVAKMNFSLLVREKNTLAADEEKSDVYSFGIVLLQVLSGRKAFTMESESERRTLSELVLKCIDEAESAEEIIDPFLMGNISHPCLRAFGEIANKCLLLNATQRPPMTEVVRKLELALQLEETANKLINNKEKGEHISEVRQFLQHAGLESCNLIVGVDFTRSNETKGQKSFNGRSLHDIKGGGLNPYEKSISIIGKALANVAHENLIPCFGFGDESTCDKEVFSFYPDKRFCNGFEQVLSRYREIVPHLKLYGPTSFAPIIEMAMTIVEQSGFKYHVLLLIADGEVSSSSKVPTLKAIVEASKLPLSIILVGVGDGPWDMMRKFSDDIPDRAFNNFHVGNSGMQYLELFVNFTEIMSKNLDESLKEAEFALTALMEIPSQNKATIELNILGGRRGNAPGGWWLCGFIWRFWELLSHRWTSNYRIFSVAEIRALTNNFNDGHLINTENGWDGMVFEGYMEKMGKVVIKRYFTLPTGTVDFYNSLRVQSHLECINMVSLVGYCLDYDGHEMILVHEYMANGTLFDHLRTTSNNNNNQCLSWKQRLQICIGAARGLNYLHIGVKEKTIIHGDVKLSNILLDQNWVAKMNFSLLVREKNTLVADEEKSDVYSFGIVLLQVLSGGKAFTMENESERRTLSELVLKCIDDVESAGKIIDPFLMGNILHPCLRAFGEIANKCLLLNATQRPPMTEVVRKLELALQLEETANKLINNKENGEHISEVRQFLQHAGLESCNLIVGVDFTRSNETKGERSFNVRSLHDIKEGGLNPYEQSISIIGKALADLAQENLIPCFGFGDESTCDKEIFSFYPDKRFCNGFEQVLSRYREIVPHLKLYGPTSFAPIIEMAMTIVEQSGFKYHVLLLITDGEVSSDSKVPTLKAIVEASKLPLSIILVGVGDGPWDMMRKFSDDIPDRAFNNFHFVSFTEIMSKSLDESLKEAEFALTALMEIPSQNKATIELNILGGRRGNAPGRVPLPPPPVGTAPPAPVQKEVHCRSISVAEIRALTNNFNDDHLINTENGGDGMVYEGYTETMGKVLIKRYCTMPTSTDDFYNSLRVQSQLECINMVSLVGYCLDCDAHEMILVHEYMANGTLFDHLHNTSNNNECLSWTQRLQICIGAARGLNYLHTGVKEKTIIHGDVKLSNILLDQNWVAKMNFSLLVREKNTLAADEEKSDVYSFGTVLLQVLSGTKAFTTENESESTLSELVLKCIDDAESPGQIIDPFLMGNISHPCLRVFGEIASKCLLLNATRRPPMTEVVCKLELALQLEEIANKLNNKEQEEHISEVSQFLQHAGLESCNLIVGIDFTASNKTKGERSFNGRSLHDINGDGLNPYEQSISIIGKALAEFAHENLIPCFGFGDESTRGTDVFSFYPDKRFCNGFEQVLSRYKEIVPHLTLYGPTSFAPIIEMAMTIVEQSGSKYHVLLLIADGEVSPESKAPTLKAIVEASKFPLSIILVGVGDGPWDMMRKFSDDIPDRAFNNFHFVNFTEIMSKNLDKALKEAEFALTALMEIPSQSKAAIVNSHPSGQKGNAPERVPQPPPPACDKNPSA